MVKLIIVWDTGEKEEYTYKTREDAEHAASNLKMAFGDQIWVGIV